MNTYDLFKKLLNIYGTQGWWPFLDTGYHKDNYSYPQNEKQLFEIYLGVVLTQNSTFNGVVKSLQNLKSLNALLPEKLLSLDIDLLKDAIKPSLYYNQKAIYLHNIANFFIAYRDKIPTRYELLNIKGIGEESADSILLYGYNEAQMVVDAYTKRIFSHLGISKDNAKYIDIKNLIESDFKRNIKSKDTLIQSYQEFHALLVEHAKLYYSKKPYGCFI